MARDGISKVGTADAVVDVKLRTLPVEDRFPVRGGAESAGLRAVSTSEKANQRREGKAAELIIGEVAHPITDEGNRESYAKIRYDKDARSVLIQIVDASSGEVVREIPPQAWARMRGVTAHHPEPQQQSFVGTKQ